MSNEEQEYKIQTIICNECKTVLGARFVRTFASDHDFCFCYLCAASICNVSGAMRLSNLPSLLDLKRLWPHPADIDMEFRMLPIHWVLKVSTTLKDLLCEN